MLGIRLFFGLGLGVMGFVLEYCLLVRFSGGRCLMGVLFVFRLSFSDSESDNSVDFCLFSRELFFSKKLFLFNSKVSSGLFRSSSEEEEGFSVVRFLFFTFWRWVEGFSRV